MKRHEQNSRKLAEDILEVLRCCDVGNCEDCPLYAEDGYDNRCGDSDGIEFWLEQEVQHETD